MREMRKYENEHDIGEICGSMSWNFEVAVVELQQSPLESCIIDVRDLWYMVKHCRAKVSKFTHDNLRGKSLVEVAALRVRR